MPRRNRPHQARGAAVLTRPTRPKKRARTGDETRTAILDAAARLFAEHGYERTSLDAIAGSIGISAPALYYHFGSKDQILFASLERTLIDLVSMAQDGVAQAPDTPPERLRAFVRAHVLHDVGDAEIMPMINASLYNAGSVLEALADDQRTRLTALQRDFADCLRDVLRKGVSAGDFRIGDVTATAFAIIGMVDFAVYWFRPGGRLSVDALAELYGEIALRMAGAA